jgi:hypothetical protein
MPGQLKTLGTFGQWMRDRLFPLIAPMIGRELERQCRFFHDAVGAGVSA